MNAPAALTLHAPSSHLGFLSTAIATFEGVEKLAGMMAKCATMPAHLVGKPADCFRIVVQAAKWGMDPFAVAECTSLVHGRMCYEGKLVAAVLSSMGAIEGRLDYEVTGKGQQASITVTGTPRGTKKPCVISGSVSDWRTVTKNKDGQRIDNAWDKMPETMLVYRGTRQWARMYAPEAILGVFTPDEREDEPRDVTASVVVHEGLPATTVATPDDARTGPAPTTLQPPAAVEARPSADTSGPSASPTAGDTAPKDPPKATAHPSIAAGKELMRNLGSDGKRILERLVKLQGAAKATDIPADRLDAFGLDITTIANVLKQVPVDMARVEDLIGGWERDAAAGMNGGAK